MSNYTFIEVIPNVMNNRTQQNVIIKGTKEGLTLHLDDSCSFQELLKEIKTKLSANYQFQENDSLIAVKVHTGNRYVTDEQKDQIKELIRQKKKLNVEEILSNVVTKDEAKQLQEQTQTETIVRVIRSGQVLEVPGHLLLIGDVNPGGTVSAGGNVNIMGTLRGIAHAGCHGNKEAVITASVMKPSQLKIAGAITRAPDQYTEEGHTMECAFLDEAGYIVVEKLQALGKIRPNLDRLEGGL
jgi:septum site-determining protein MinC